MQMWHHCHLPWGGIARQREADSVETDNAETNNDKVKTKGRRQSNMHHNTSNQLSISSFKALAGVKIAYLQPMLNDRINFVFTDKEGADKAREQEKWLKTLPKTTSGTDPEHY
ncbi:Hypothetical protein D9617_77g092380 [Elsinoe fawcettii]|nr:Hypothetical protein D9617_77g092380 [Elsinoe fawcettii]